LLALVYLVAGYVNRLSVVPDTKEGQREDNEMVSATTFSSLLSLAKWPSFDWSSSIRWEGLSQLSLPVSLSVADNEMVGSTVGKGMGVATELVKFDWQMRRSRPTFDTPPPALYQSQAPLSMAKLIMSRHTVRRPTNKPRSPPQPPARRNQNMV